MQSCIRWYKHSIIAVSAVVGLTMFIQIYGYYRLNELKIFVARTAEFEDGLSSIKKRYKKYLTKKSIAASANAHLFAEFLAYLGDNIPSDVRVDLLTVENKKKIILTGQTKSLESIDVFLTALSENPALKESVIDSIGKTDKKDIYNFKIHILVKNN